MHLWLGGCPAVHGGQEVYLSGFIQRARGLISLRVYTSGTMIFSLHCYYIG